MKTTSIPTAYSYVRLSSKRQIKGTGSTRQFERFKEICKEKGWTPSDKNFADLGVSAFGGKNRLKGDLANFISLTKKSQLGEHPILCLEQFDRFSRQDIDDSEPAILDLLKSGVDIHISFSGKTFTRDSTKDLNSRIEILTSLKQAYDYSANLSKRVKGANKIRKEQIRNGEIVKHRNTPLYYSFDANKKQYVQNDRAKIAKRIIDEFLAGKTLYAVARTLNDETIPRIGYAKTTKWEVMNIKNILANPAIYGAIRETKKETDPKTNTTKRINTILDANFYSEPLIDKATFDKIQTLLRNRNKYKGRHSDYINIFRGLCRCKYCKGSMAMFSDTINRRTGEPHKTPYRYFRCTGVNNGSNCENRHAINVKDVEEEFFAMFLKQDPQTVFKSDNNSNQAELNIIESELAVISKRFTNLARLTSDNPDVPEFTIELAELKKERETLFTKKQDLGNANLDKSVYAEMAINFKKLLEEIDFGFEELDDALDTLHEQLQNPELRLKLRLMLSSIVSKIEFNTKKREIEIFDLNGKSIYTTFAH